MYVDYREWTKLLGQVVRRTIWALVYHLLGDACENGRIESRDFLLQGEGFPYGVGAALLLDGPSNLRKDVKAKRPKRPPSRVRDTIRSHR